MEWKRYIKSPRKVISALGFKGFLNWVPDETYLKWVFWSLTGKRLNLESPTTFNEKLQWLKLHNRKPEYTSLVDKYEVRSYIAATIGEEYLIPLNGVYNSVHEIKWEDLPDSFVLKCTHGSGWNIICKDKSTLDINQARKELSRWMKENWYWHGREWPYKNVKPRIICEKYMEDESGNQLKDYKIFCFNVEPRIIEVDFNRFIEHKRNIYTTDWEFVDVEIQFPNDPQNVIMKPKSLDLMLQLAKKLSAGIPHVRIDFYSINNKVYFGEITFFHESGFAAFSPESMNHMFGSWINLSVN